MFWWEKIKDENNILIPNIGNNVLYIYEGKTISYSSTNDIEKLKPFIENNNCIKTATDYFGIEIEIAVDYATALEQLKENENGKCKFFCNLGNL